MELRLELTHKEETKMTGPILEKGDLERTGSRYSGLPTSMERLSSTEMDVGYVESVKMSRRH